MTLHWATSTHKPARCRGGSVLQGVSVQGEDAEPAFTLKAPLTAVRTRHWVSAE